MSLDGNKVFEPELETRPIRYDRNVLPYRRPYKGWNYHKDGIIFSGNSHSDLVRNIIQYRLKNGMRLGNPNYEVEQYICRKNLHLAEFGESQYLKEEEIDPFTEYLKKVKVSCGKRMLDHLVHERKFTCEKCPCNQRLKKDKTYEKEALLIAGELHRGKLFQCSEQIWDNMIAVNYDDHGCHKWVS